MARCDEGYLCDVCGEEVEGIIESDLYLRYVLGEVDPETLHVAPERHIPCNPTMGQFIVAEDFEPIQASGLFSKEGLDPEYVAREEERVTRGFLRLREILASTEPIPITDYPLPGVMERWKTEPDGEEATSPESSEPVPRP